MSTRKKFNLRAFVLSEAAKLSGKTQPVEKVKAVEIEAGEEAQQLELDIDYIKALKIKEAKINAMHRKLVKEMRKVQAKKSAVKKKIIKKI
jgi:hypothetical protein